ncbi:MAG: DUF3187 family protein [Nitrospirota bacterium]
MTGVNLRKILLLAGASLFLVFVPGAQGAPGGPLRVVNSHPLFLATGAPRLREARCRSFLGATLTYSSTFELESSPEWTASIDLEAAVLTLEAARLLGDRTEVGAELPVIGYQSGVLDGPLNAYHDAFGFGDYGRHTRPENDFLFVVKRRGKTVVEGRAGRIAPGDVRLWLKEAVYRGNPYVSLYGFLDLPTGDPDRGFGSGELHGGAAVLLDASLRRGLTAYLNGGAVFMGSYRGQEVDVPLHDFLYGGAGIEWEAAGRLSLLTQLMAQGSPFDTGIRELDTVSLLWSLGLRYGMGEGSALEASFSEDPNTAGAPDFMVSLGYRYTFRQ